MTNFLEELYYGNIDPQARGYRKGSYNFKVSQNINELEEKLTERLGGEDKALFLDFCNAYGELMGENGLDSFLVGFRYSGSPKTAPKRPVEIAKSGSKE